MTSFFALHTHASKNGSWGNCMHGFLDNRVGCVCLLTRAECGVGCCFDFVYNPLELNIAPTHSISAGFITPLLQVICMTSNQLIFTSGSGVEPIDARRTQTTYINCTHVGAFRFPTVNYILPPKSSISLIWFINELYKIEQIVDFS